jgi:hypothetical protein
MSNVVVPQLIFVKHPHHKWIPGKVVEVAANEVKVEIMSPEEYPDIIGRSLYLTCDSFDLNSLPQVTML